MRSEITRKKPKIFLVIVSRTWQDFGPKTLSGRWEAGKVVMHVLHERPLNLLPSRVGAAFQPRFALYLC